MSSPISNRGRLPGVRLLIRGADPTPVAAEQVGLFLFDFTVAFEVFRSFVESGGAGRVTNWDLYRGHRRVQPLERLAIQRLRMESPIEVVATAITLSGIGVGGLWAAVQAMERIYMLPLNRQKAELEIRKLEAEVALLEGDYEPRQLGTAAIQSFGDGERRSEELLRSKVLRHTSLEKLMPPTDAADFEDDSHDENRRVFSTLRRRLLRNPIQVEQLELEFDDHLLPPAD